MKTNTSFPATLALLFCGLMTTAQADTPRLLADANTLRALDLPLVSAISTQRDGTSDIMVEDHTNANGISGETLIDLGSITKFVTAVATLHLIDAGHFSTQSTLQELLADVPADKAQITIHQLLTHSSGLINSTGDDEEPLTRAAFLSRVLALPLAHEPGGPYLYSNAGYSVLAAIIEQTSGKAYEDYLIDDILTPLGLTPIGYDAAYTADRSLRSDRIWRTGFARAPIRAASWGDQSPGWNLIGNGGTVTTVEGFVDFWNAFLDGTIVNPALVSAALTPHVDEGLNGSFYGYGLVVEDSPSLGRMYWHNGGNDVFSAEWRHFSDHDTTIMLAGTGEDAFVGMDRLMTAAE